MSRIDELLKNEKVEWKKLGDIAIISGAGVDKKIKDDEKPVVLLNYMDVYRNLYLNKSVPSMEVTASDIKINECDVRHGDIFITPSSETKEDIFISSVAKENIKNTVYSYHIMRIRLKEKNFTTSCFLNYVFRSQNFRKNMFKKVFGNTRQTIAKSEIEKLEVPVPSLEMQEKIVKILDKFTNYVTKLQAELQDELQARNKQYEHYRDIILSEEYLKKIYYKIFESENSYYKIKTMKLGEICEINTGFKPKIVIKDEGQYKYINGGTIESGYLDSYNCDEDTVTTPSRGQGGIGFIGYQHDKFWLGALCYSIKSINKDRISNKFIYYYLSHSNHILKLKKEGGTPAINLSDLKNIRISFPILEVQNKVVEVLDKFQDLLSDTQGLLPEEIEQRQKQYEYYREKLLTFEDKSDSTPHAAK